jgi:hypothetical protein
LYTPPKIIKRNAVVEGGGVNDFFIFERQKPGIRITIGLIITRRTGRVE